MSALAHRGVGGGPSAVTQGSPPRASADPATRTPAASVVIPAFNEATVLGRCLDALMREIGELPVEVIVAANGCTDATVDVARRYPGVRVVDLPAVGKPAALNAGDDLATAFPRIYLDADVELAGDALTALIHALSCAEARLAAPTLVIDSSECSPTVRAFYRVFLLLPFATSQVIGRGVYALNGAGRARFGTFPDAQGDDLFVGRHFHRGEQVSSGGVSIVRPPRTTRALLAVLTRVHRGNAALSRADGGPQAPDLSRSTASTATALTRLLRGRPSLLPAVGVYAGLTLLARARARASAGSATWNRDPTRR